ncbi:hypothetical protein F5890DRAFT_1557036 [Lentinula detonsa]|uniref:Uncharacterized protein n=1 Tax=Lentinula detonsa TaxID=2804962 RepID=A0AA38PTY6_9AGAR|nr:hypothetical protein F5890DRAFT_1557036 [Lentinula detonsa]
MPDTSVASTKRTTPSPSPEREREPITYRLYTGEPDLPHIISLIASELSEPFIEFKAYWDWIEAPQRSHVSPSPEPPEHVSYIT